MSPVERIMIAVARQCDALGLPYFVTGSVAAMAWGESRHTLDVDVVVELPSWKASDFCAAFPAPSWYASEDAAREASARGGQFNIILPSEGVKADIMIFVDKPFNNSRLARAKPVMFGDQRVMFAAPEDVILKKLEYFREGASDKHLRDVTSIIKVSGPEIDFRYLEDWALRIGVMAEWRAIKQRLGMA